MNASITPRRMMIYGAGVAIVLAWSFMGQSSEEAGTAAARPSGDVTGAEHRATALNANAAAFLTRLAHRTADSKTAPALFASRSWYVPPPPPPPAPVAVPAGPPPAPTAPPLPFVFMGSYAAQGDAVTYFLERGDRIYDVKVGDGVDADYSLVAVEGGNMIFNYKPLNARQSLALGGAL
jgi:hypothetical protein